MKKISNLKLKLALIPLVCVIVVWGMILSSGLDLIEGYKEGGGYETWRYVVAYSFLLGPPIGGTVGVVLILRKLEKRGDFILFKDPLRSIIEHEHKREESDKSLEESFKKLYGKKGEDK